MSCLESIHVSHPHGLDLGGGLSELMVFPDLAHIQGFESCVNEYSKRILSYESDTLNAFQGILQLFRKLGLFTFFGLPLNPSGIGATNQAVCALLWNFHDMWDSEHKPVRRPGFPSWTWLGWKATSHIHFFTASLSNPEADVEVIVEISKDGENDILQWESQSSDILQLIDCGSRPHSIQITGWCLDLYYSRVSMDEPWTRIIEADHTEEADDHFSPSMDQTLNQASLETTHESLTVIFLCEEGPKHRRKWEDNFSSAFVRRRRYALVLRKMSQGVCFERLGWTKVAYEGDCPIARLPFSNLWLERRQVRIG